MRSLVLLLVVAVASSCGTASPASPGDKASPDRSTVKTASGDHLEVTFLGPKKETPRNWLFQVNIKNLEPREVDLGFGPPRPGGFDIVIKDGQGREVWRRLGDKTAAIQILQKVQPGDTFPLRYEWSIPEKIQEGEYVAKQSFDLDNELIESNDVRINIG